MNRSPGYAIGVLVFGFALALLVSTAANAHGRAPDGHHARGKIVSVARTAAPAERAPARQIELRDAQRAAAAVPASEPLTPAIANGEPSLVAQGPKGASSRQLRVDVAHGLSEQPLGMALKVSPGGIQTAAFDVAKASLSAQSGIGACCAHGRGCCCQGASACGSCGTTCCTGAVAPVGQLGAARDRCYTFHGFRSVNLVGTSIGPADRPPAPRI